MSPKERPTLKAANQPFPKFFKLVFLLRFLPVNGSVNRPQPLATTGICVAPQSLVPRPALTIRTIRELAVHSLQKPWAVETVSVIWSPEWLAPTIHT